MLLVHLQYNDPFKPKSTTRQLLLKIISFYDKKETLQLEELIVYAKSIKSSYKVTHEEAMNLEELTRMQSRCCLWGNHRAGRITVSNFREVFCTSLAKPALSLVKELCFPKVYKFFSAATSWECEHEWDAIQDFLP